MSFVQYLFYFFTVHYSLTQSLRRLYKERRYMRHSLTYCVFKMSRYPIPAWDERPFCDCGKPAKLRISLEDTTYGRRYWVCPDDDEWFEVSLFYITVASIKNEVVTYIILF